jgi:hypothetical protein
MSPKKIDFQFKINFQETAQTKLNDAAATQGLAVWLKH